MAEDAFFEAEQQVMSTIINGNETDLLPDDLMDDRHQEMLTAVIALRDDGVVPDVITINHKMQELSGSQLSECRDYLIELRDLYSNPKRQEVYEGIVKDRALRAKVVAHARALLHEEADGVRTDDLLVMAQTKPLALGAGRATTNTSLAQDVAYDVLDEIQARRGSNKLTGLATPWKRVNELTNGLQSKDLIIIAGRPSMGKTALAGQIAQFAAIGEGPVFIGSLEMDRSSLVERQLCGDARVDSERVRSGYVNQSEFERLQVAVERLQDSYPIVINDSARLSAQELRMSIAQANLKYNGLSVAVIDYLGLLKDDGNGQQRYKEVGDAVKVMRATAKEIGIPVILVCQLNRSCETRENKRPVLSDLRESGDIEQDSDVIFFLYRDEYYCHECASATEVCGKGHQGVAELICRKQRKGPVGTVSLTWEAKYTKFSNLHKGDFYGESTMDSSGPCASDFALPEERAEDDGTDDQEKAGRQREITF
ncbi:MAG: replicative DNA helicase [Planctomycetota bacterium]|jgi:replicative DNA helicase